MRSEEACVRRKAPGFSLDMEAAANEEQLALREDEAEVWRQWSRRQGGG